MPSARRPTHAEVSALVKSGKITAEEGLAMLAPPQSPPRPQWLGPAPDGRGAVPAMVGLGGALVVSALAIVADTVAASRTRLDPGDLLTWLPGAFAVLAVVAAGFARGSVRTACGAMALALPCLVTLLHPSPQPWMYLVPPAAALLALALRMDPATRVVLGLPAVIGWLQVCFVLLEPADSQSALAVLLLGGYLFALAFAVPYESGWRRAPFLANATLAGLVLGVAATEMALHPGRISDPSLGDLLTGALVLVAYPMAVWASWNRASSRGFLLPSLPAWPTSH